MNLSKRLAGCTAGTSCACAHSRPPSSAMPPPPPCRAFHDFAARVSLALHARGGREDGFSALERAESSCAQTPPLFTGSDVRVRLPDMPKLHFAIAFKGAAWTDDPDAIPLMVMQSMLGAWSSHAGAGAVCTPC